MTLQLGEVVLLRMEYHEAHGSKIRPALVILDTGDDDFVAAPITSRRRQSEFELPISQWQATGLNVASFARIHKLTVLPKADILRHLGQFARPDRELLVALLCQAYCPRAIRHE